MRRRSRAWPCWWCSSTAPTSPACARGPSPGSARNREARSVTLPQEEAFARIRLLRSPNVGPVSYAQLLRRFGDAQAALAALPDLAARGGSPYRPAPEARVAEEIAAVKRSGARYLFHDSPDYPALLAASDGA